MRKCKNKLREIDSNYNKFIAEANKLNVKLHISSGTLRRCFERRCVKHSSEKKFVRERRTAYML